MLRNFNLILGAILSIAYFKVALRRHQIGGVIIVTLGLIVIAIYGLMYSVETSNYHRKDWIGVVMALAGTFLSSFQAVCEEALLRKYFASPFEAVGLMGVYGIIIGCIALVILQFIGGEKTTETIYMLKQRTKESNIIIIAIISFVLSISIFNGSGLMVRDILLISELNYVQMS